MSSLGLLQTSPPMAGPGVAVPAAWGRRVDHHADPELPEAGHRSRTVAALAARLADLVGGHPDAAYLVPDSTLLAGPARALGIFGEDDLFGGVVPARVLAGKAITHPVADAEGCPEGWCEAFCPAVADHVLPGLSAFSRAAALKAGARMLEGGPVRLKPGWTDGGIGQSVIADADDLPAALEALDEASLARWGLVIERNLEEALTFSIGRFRVGGHALAYVGTQSMTRDNAGQAAYGGSRLLVRRGDFSGLADARLSPVLRRMVAHARAYDLAADAHLKGFFASRRNYDLVLGRDAAGNILSGVLEASWRIGGASGAEIAALRAFAEDPELTCVVAACHEVYGRTVTPPKEADVYCDADDPDVGPITKYAVVESRSYA